MLESSHSSLTEFLNPQKVREFVKDYQSILIWIGGGVITAVIFCWRLVSARLEWRRNARTLRSKVGADLYTRDDILRATKFFIEPDCQSVDPSGAEDFRRVYSTQESAFKVLDRLFGSESPERYTLLLGDSGMGKTTLLLNYYARHARKRRSAYRLAIVPLGSQEADRTIDSLQLRSETVLLLDAFDEDTQAIQDHKMRLFSLLGQTKEFQHVLITCRTQFFASTDEIPRETGLLRIGLTSAAQTKDYTFNKIYVAPFSSKQVRSYLRLVFPMWQLRERRKAASIAARIPDLTMRPMLLAHIRDILSSNRGLTLSAEIYEKMIEAWLQREKPFVNPTNLRKFSGDLAVDIYKKRELRGSEKIPPTEATELAKQRNIPLEEWQLRGRSLLNRDAEGNLKFAHRTILEYLFALEFIRNPASCPHLIWTDQIKTFWWEELLRLLQDRSNASSSESSKAIQSSIDRARDLGDLTGLDALSLRPMTLLPSAKQEHPDLRSLRAFFSQFCDFDRTTERWTKRSPELLQSVTLPNHGFQGTSTSAVVDFATGLMWESLCSPVASYDEAIALATGAIGQPTGGLSGWRIPSLREALSLLPISADSYLKYPSCYPFSAFESWFSMIWTTDVVPTVGRPQHVVCAFHDKDLAYPQTHASLRLVRTIGQSNFAPSAEIPWLGYH